VVVETTQAKLTSRVIAIVFEDMGGYNLNNTIKQS
jgi:hypothetical protein